MEVTKIRMTALAVNVPMVWEAGSATMFKSPTMTTAVRISSSRLEIQRWFLRRDTAERIMRMMWAVTGGLRWENEDGFSAPTFSRCILRSEILECCVNHHSGFPVHKSLLWTIIFSPLEVLTFNLTTLEHFNTPLLLALVNSSDPQGGNRRIRSNEWLT